jgi:outer membrane protein assembly factor BamB
LYDASNVVVTIRNQDTVAIFDWSRGRLVWAWGQGELQRPHDAAILAGGNLLIFDNRPADGWSRVIELNPRTRKIEWEYRVDPPEDFFSATRGTAQRLANGNTLIGESNGGRAFEVTPEGRIVWDFLIPHLNKRGHPAAFRIERYEASRIEASKTR